MTAHGRSGGGTARILVVRGGAIGDFVLTLPAIAALRRRFSGAVVEVLGYPGIAQLAQAAGLAEAVKPIESAGLAGFFVAGGELDSAWTNYFSRFGLVVSYLHDPDGIFEANVRRCSSARFIAGAHRPDEKQEIHATRVYLKALEPLGIQGEDPVPRLRLKPAVWEDGSAARTWLAIHPGSGGERKNWPEEAWAALLRRIETTTEWRLLLVGGEAEGGRLLRLASRLPLARRSIAQNLPLADLAGRLLSCAAFAGHDSGITHLAAALGLPCLALWARTSDVVWRPLGADVAVLKGPAGIASLGVDRVMEELRGRMASGSGRSDK